MPKSTYEKTQALIEEEIGERLKAAERWDTACLMYSGNHRDEGDTHMAAARAHENRADCHRLNRKKLDIELEVKEVIR